MGTYGLAMQRVRSIPVLLPLIPIFAIAILCRSSTYEPLPIKDETKFVAHAENLTHGYYAERENTNLMEGPGYPIVLAVPAALNIPWPAARILNMLWLFLAARFLFLILRKYLKQPAALVLTYLFALYPPMLRWANLMYAESFMLFLLLGFCYHFIWWFNREERPKRHLLFAMLFLGYLALTKIIFAYVIVATLAGCLILMAFRRIATAYRLQRSALIFTGALAVFSPYVIHNYILTGKFFYLGTHGGLILYHRSTPYEHEFGNFFSEEHVLRDIGPGSTEDVMTNTDQLRINHEALMRKGEALSWMGRDSLFMAEAVKNIKSHPDKYVKNTVANVSRIFFHFPFSYRMQNLDTLGYLLPNMFVLVLAILGIYPAFIRRNVIPKELIVLLLIMLIYFGGHSLLGGRGRFFIPMVPVLIIFFSFVYLRLLEIRFRAE